LPPYRPGRPARRLATGSLFRNFTGLRGLGTQTHLDIDVAPGQIKAAIKDLASLGLPSLVSELGVSLSSKRIELRTVADQFHAQAARVAEAADAFMDLPPAQRLAFSVWGLLDTDSWLRAPPNDGEGTDQPLLFDDQGRPKPAFEALAGALKRP